MCWQREQVRVSLPDASLNAPCQYHALNRAFWSWVEDEYHQREHGSLGMKPLDRLALDLPRIRFLSPGDVSDELFFVEQERSVLADNTFSLKNTRFVVASGLRRRWSFCSRCSPFWFTTAAVLKYDLTAALPRNSYDVSPVMAYDVNSVPNS